jgi:hypothetical protein
VQADLLGLLNGVKVPGAPASAAAAAGATGNGAVEVDRRAARRADTPATASRAQAKGKAGKKAR